MQVLIAKIVESYNPAYGQPARTARSKDAGKSQKFGWFFTPVLGSLLSNRWLTGIFLGVGLTQLLLVAIGVPGWQCPIENAFGIRCPGCGLTTAMTLLVTGQWAAAVGMHAFAPLFLVVIAGMAVAIALPTDYLRKLSASITAIECKTGLTAIVIVSMLLYWLLRIFTL